MILNQKDNHRNMVDKVMRKNQSPVAIEMRKGILVPMSQDRRIMTIKIEIIITRIEIMRINIGITTIEIGTTIIVEPIENTITEVVTENTSPVIDKQTKQNQLNNADNTATTKIAVRTDNRATSPTTIGITVTTIKSKAVRKSTTQRTRNHNK